VSLFWRRLGRSGDGVEDGKEAAAEAWVMCSLSGCCWLGYGERAKQESSSCDEGRRAGRRKEGTNKAPKSAQTPAQEWEPKVFIVMIELET